MRFIQRLGRTSRFRLLGLLFPLWACTSEGETGEPVEIAGWRFTVMSLDGRRIDQIRAEPADQPDEADEKLTSESPRASENSAFRYSLSD